MLRTGGLIYLCTQLSIWIHHFRTDWIHFNALSLFFTLPGRQMHTGSYLSPNS